ncbi:hydrogenase 4 subunit D [Orbus sturtevantii]|uniref:hydrogenase 4 subunit D n=1 Tax=Orbus sturtevantii TaxID=3074109 RepID=UPI00370D754C
MENIAIATIIGPFIGALIIACLPYSRSRLLGVVVSLLASFGITLLGYMLLKSSESSYYFMLFKLGETEILGILVDKVSTLIGFAVVFLGFLVCVYSTAYLTKQNREHPHEGTKRYYALLMVFIGAMAGLVLSSTLIGQLLFFEITGGCSWALIGYYQTAKSQRSALKALLVTHIAALGLYLAASWLFVETGTFSLMSIAQVNDTAKIIIVGGILFAAWGKSAQLPLHVWLPDAMEAPTPVSAYLHAASMVKVGVYIFARAIMSSGNIPIIIGEVGMVLSAISLVYGFVMYLPQTDMKRLLAYSTITQLSYIFFALSLSIYGFGTVYGTMAFAGGIAYIFNHAFAKSLFFLVAGALSFSCGTRMLPKLKGIITVLPLLGIGFCVAALAISGVPPFNGFFSKYPIFAAGFGLFNGNWLVMALLIIILIESVGSFAWFLYWFGKTVPGKPSDDVANASPVPLAMKVVIIILIIMSLCSSVIASLWLN